MDAYQRRLRWSSFTLGVMILFWLPIEDTTFYTATLLAVAVCFLGGIAYAQKTQITSRNFAWLGLVAGGCIGVLSFLLMVFKIGLHNHRAPDFTLGQLTGLLQTTPIWSVAGFLLGLSLHLYLVSRSS
ncbi:MAG TPA: hypothetical protein PK530_02625 [Anaerolineales bacterium]|nr:hypothetical protein [Anaerolineales bacterium]